MTRLIRILAAWWCVEFTAGAITGWREAGRRNER